MGIMRCEDHGLRGIEHVCEHLRHAVDVGSELPAFAKYPLLMDGPSPEVWLVLYFCHECVARRGLPVPERELSETEQTREYHGILDDLEVVCERCFKRRAFPSEGTGPSPILRCPFHAPGASKVMSR